jgi:hypothetical protein
VLGCQAFVIFAKANLRSDMLNEGIVIGYHTSL